MTAAAAAASGACRLDFYFFNLFYFFGGFCGIYHFERHVGTTTMKTLFFSFVSGCAWPARTTIHDLIQARRTLLTF